jgi:gluconolactonase
VLRTLVDHYEGKKFNSPNDIVVAANGDVYFTDPRYRGAEPVELDFEGVFLVRTGKAILATRDTERPNGIVISSNGKTAYVADNNNREGGARTLLKFNVNADGTFSHKKVLHRFSETQRGIDGMTLGPGGDVYATAGKGQDAGVYVFSPSGKVRDVIRVPDVPTNCIFGGADEPKVLYITAQTGHTLPDGGPACGLLRIKLP